MMAILPPAPLKVAPHHLASFVDRVKIPTPVAVILYFETRVYFETRSEICARISPIFPIFTWDSEMGFRVKASVDIENLRPNGKLFLDLRREV